MRFIHAADLHLDTAFAIRSEGVRKRLREASRGALRRLVDLALSEQVDAVILAGDLFDGDRISFQTERLLAAETGRLAEAGIPVVYAAGNHDPARADSRAATLQWPPNVHMAQGPDPIRVEITGISGRPVGSITAVGHEHAEVEDDLVPLFPPPTGEGVHVAVMHATVLGSPQAAAHARYAPTDIDSLKATGYHYWALGHIHVREALSTSPGVHYPGNTQGRSPREGGPKGCLLVDLGEAEAPRVTFHRLGTIQWEHIRLDQVESCHTMGELMEAAREEWDKIVRHHASDPPSDWIVTVTVSGPSPLFRELSDDAPQELARELRDSFGILEVEVLTKQVCRPVKLEDHLNRQDVLGEALRLVQSSRADGWTVSDDVELLGLGDGMDRAEYVAELLDGAESEVLARMLKMDSDTK